MQNSSTISNETINEINRLNDKIRALEEDKQQLDNRNRQLAYELDYQNQNYNLIGREKDEMRRIIIDLETKIKNISSQG
jgi:chromosome segregation ATPase